MKRSQSIRERLWGDLKGGGEPPVSQASYPSQSGIRAPTANPDRRPRLLNRQRFESSSLPGIEVATEGRCIWAQQTAQQRNRFVKSLPTLFASNSLHVIGPSKDPRAASH